MNDYQIKERAKADQLRAEVEAIANAMDWQVLPECKGLDYPERTVSMVNEEGFEIYAMVEWNSGDKITFSASVWPEYKDKNGEVQKLMPHRDTWSPKEVTPRTRAARSRNPKAIAKQIKSRLMPEYRRIYERLQEVATSRGQHAQNEAGNMRRMVEATQETGKRSEPYRVQNLEGDAVYVTRQASDSFKMEFKTDDAIAVIEFLRARRSK